jgi:hypothetical protein
VIPVRPARRTAARTCSVNGERLGSGMGAS